VYFADLAQEIGMAEIVIPAESRMIGKSVAEAKFPETHDVTAIGVRRGGVAFDRHAMTRPLKVGDTLLVIGPWRNIRTLQSEREDLFVLNLPRELAEVLPAASRAPFALACLLLTVGLMVSGIVTNVHAALIGCLLMGASRCIDMTSAYRSIHWQTLLLIVGMLPFSTALQRTGGVDLAADGLLAILGGSGIHLVLACLFGVTAVLGLFISNTATAVLMTPVALALATDLHSSPYPFAMTVALGASAAFMTPVSSPVNTLVVTPGNYGFADFLRVGVPFTVIVLIVSVLLVPLILPP
jgi:di/tricarboxylate transporter